MQKISIVGNGSDYDIEKLVSVLQTSDYIIAVDGGLNLLHKLNISPNLILGDLDSVDRRVLDLYTNVKKEVYPTEKDLTDSEIALKISIEMKAKVIDMCCMTGDYLDHTLANILILLRYFDREIEIKLITSNSTIFMIKGYKEFNNLSKRRVSFFPISDCEIILNGFKYNYKKRELNLLDYSISNVIESDTASIELKYGMVLCTLFDENYF